MKVHQGLKRALSVAGLCVLSAAAVVIYWNQHLYYRALKADDSELKLGILKQAVRLHPFNELVYYELGKVNFSLTVEHIRDAGTSREYLEDSISAFKRSLRLNPAAAAVHYSLGCALQYADFLGMDEDSGAFSEFEGAIKLAGHNRQIIHETAKLYLSRWETLSGEEKLQAEEILRKAACTGERGSLLELLHGWALNVADYDVIEAALPQEEWVYSLYAEFLGTQSMSCRRRHEFLAKAEGLRFKRAQEIFQQAERSFVQADFKEAFRHYSTCSNLLGSLRFYQNLNGDTFIRPGDFLKLKQESSLKLGLCELRWGGEWEKIEPYLQQYLALEDSMAELDELEQMLQGRGLLNQSVESGLDDLERMAFQIKLNNRQNRFRDSIKLGSRIRDSFVLIPRERIKDYAEVMLQVGDANQQADFLYDAADYYRLALDADPGNLKALLRLRANYTRLDQKAELKALNVQIAERLSPEVLRFEHKKLRRGRTERQDLVLDGERIGIEIRLGSETSDPPPLISVLLNGTVLVDDYIDNGRISITVDPEDGRNTLEIMAINRDAVLEEIRLTAN